MALNNPSPGFFSVNEFQASPLPWAVNATTSGTDVARYQLQRVSKNLVLVNHASVGTYLRLGFTENGVNGLGSSSFLLVDGKDSIELDVRIKELYVRAAASGSVNYSMYVGLTTIMSTQMPMLSGSLSDGSPGWGGVG